MPAISRRRFLSSAASGAAVLLGGGVLAPPAAAATDEELAFANFGAATELLLKDFYAQVGEAKLFGGALRRAFARGGFASTEHAAALAALLTGAGQTAPLEEDFEFVWPRGTFAARKPAATAGDRGRGPARRLPDRGCHEPDRVVPGALLEPRGELR